MSDKAQAIVDMLKERYEAAVRYSASVRLQRRDPARVLDNLILDQKCACASSVVAESHAAWGEAHELSVAEEIVKLLRDRSDVARAAFVELLDQPRNSSKILILLARDRAEECAEHRDDEAHIAWVRARAILRG